MVAISKSSLVSAIWQNFYDTIESGVTTITLADTSEVTIQTYTSSFPDTIATTKSSYPILVVESPNGSWEHRSFGKMVYVGTINIEVYATKSEAGEKFLDDIINTVETKKFDFAVLGLKQVFLEGTDYVSDMIGDIKVHTHSATFKFEYTFSRTRAF